MAIEKYIETNEKYSLYNELARFQASFTRNDSPKLQGKIS